MRAWSVRNAHWLKAAYHGLENLLVRLSPVFEKLGYDRVERPVMAVEKRLKGFLFDSKSCGQCALGVTGMSCPMNCPKQMRNGPCGGVRADGKCEIEPDMDCVWVNAWEGNKRLREAEYPIQLVQPAVDARLNGSSAWLREVRRRTQNDAERP